MRRTSTIRMIRNAVGACVLLFAPLALAAGGEPELTLTNGREKSAVRLFISPSGANSWGNDVLTSETLAPHASITIQLSSGTCTYDLSIVWSDGNSQIRRGLDLCQKSDIAIF